MTQARLQTFGDWLSLLNPPLRRVDDETLSLLRTGTFEESSSSRVFGLIKENVESLINGQTSSLLRMLDECSGSPDDIVMAIEKYDKSCRRVLELCDVKGLPQTEADKLSAEAMSYVSGVLAELKNEFGEAGSAVEDVEYCLLKLEKCWMIHEQLRRDKE